MTPFGTSTGNSAELQAAMDRRAQGQAPATSVQSSSSAGFDPTIQPSAPVQSSPSTPMAGVPISPTQTMGNDEAKIIVKALSERLKGLSQQP